MKDRPRTESLMLLTEAPSVSNAGSWGQSVKRQEKNTGQLKEVAVVKWQRAT